MMIEGFSAVKNGQQSSKTEAYPKSRLPEDVLNILKESSDS